MLVNCPRCLKLRTFRICLLGVENTEMGTSQLALCLECGIVVVITVEVVKVLDDQPIEVEPDDDR